MRKCGSQTSTAMKAITVTTKAPQLRASIGMSSKSLVSEPKTIASTTSGVRTTWTLSVQRRTVIVDRSGRPSQRSQTIRARIGLRSQQVAERKAKERADAQGSGTAGSERPSRTSAARRKEETTESRRIRAWRQPTSLTSSDHR
jgi:hypothetical protein